MTRIPSLCGRSTPWSITYSVAAELVEGDSRMWLAASIVGYLRMLYCAG